MGERRSERATILFTDLVGSTAVRSSLGEERADALQTEHDRLLAACVDEHGGRVVKSLGDGAMAAFDSASDAIAAAVAIQVAASAYGQSPRAVASLTLRIGLSTGDVSWDDAGDCFGTPVVEAARLEAVAEPGQILCATLTRMITRGRGGHEFVELGEIDLKGLPEPLSVCEVRWAFDPDSSPVAFPLPGALDTAHAGIFVGRTDELRMLAGRVGSDDTPLSVACLVGEPGIGKTRLAAEIAGLRHAAGTTVLFGRCEEDLPVPFRPFVEALTSYVRHLPADELARRLGPDPARLGLLCPDIWSLVAGIERPERTAAEVEQFRLFEAVRGWLAENRLLVVVDDLHWATLPTIQLLRHLLRSAEPSRSSIIATVRDTEMPTQLAKLLDDTAAAGSMTVVELVGLGTADVARMLADEHDSGDLDPEDLLARSGGNPFFVRALLHDRTSGGFATAAAAVRRRIHRVPEASQECLTVGALLGLQFELGPLAAVRGEPTRDALVHVEEGVHAGLVREVGPNVFRFLHAIVRDAILSRLGDTRRLQLHERVGEALARLSDAQPGEIAHHFTEAVVDDETARRAAGWHRLAAERALGLAAFADAAVHYRRASRLLPDDDVEARLTLEVESYRADYDAGVLEHGDRLGEIAASARERHLVDVDAWALVTAFDVEASTGGPIEWLVDPLVAIDVDRVSDPFKQARTAAMIPIAWIYSGRELPEDIDVLVERAFELADRADDPGGRSLAHQALGHLVGRREPTNVVARIEHFHDAVAASASVDDVHDAGHHSWLLVGALIELGDIDATERPRGLLRRYAELGDNPWARFMYDGIEAMLALVAGRLRESEELSLVADESAESISGFRANGVLGMRMFAIRREQGRLGELRTMVELAQRRRVSTEGIWRPGAAALFADLGMVEPATRQLESLVSNDGPLVPTDSRFTTSMSFLADACVLVEDVPRAAVVHEALAPYSGLTVTMPGCTCLGPVDRYLARLAAVMGDADQALGRLDTALALAERMHSPLFAAQVLVDRGSVLAHLGDVQGAHLSAHAAIDAVGGLDLPRAKALAEALLAVDTN